MEGTTHGHNAWGGATHGGGNAWGATHGVTSQQTTKELTLLAAFGQLIREMARPLRIDLPGAWHHVTARGNERRAIFRGEHDFARRMEILDVN